MSRLLVLGDIHGAHRSLVQVLERAKVDRDNDRVIFLGDVADGWPDTRQCIDELLTLKHLTFILGNHDEWLRKWVRTGWIGFDWLSQGGRATVFSYLANPRYVPLAHVNFLESAKHWHQDGDRIFVHAGWRQMFGHPGNEDPEVLMWDRALWAGARQWAHFKPHHRLTDFAEVYIGHTSTEAYSLEPVQACEVWNLDQGCGWSGRLTLMDVDTKEFWQSDRSVDLYPEHRGRAA